MAFNNLLSWVPGEVDANDRLTVTASQVTVTQGTLGDSPPASLADFKGTGAFVDGFTADCKGTLIGYTGTSFVPIFCFSNVVNGFAQLIGLTDFVILYYSNSTGGLVMRHYNAAGGVLSQSVSGVVGLGIERLFKARRSGAFIFVDIYNGITEGSGIWASMGISLVAIDYDNIITANYYATGSGTSWMSATMRDFEFTGLPTASKIPPHLFRRGH